MKTEFTKLIILFSLLFISGILYRRYENKLQRENRADVYESIQKYLLGGSDEIGDDEERRRHLERSQKPILWIHIPYEYNSRNWVSFGSRNTFDLNQPYLYLTVRSIIRHCGDDFVICIIDDHAFEKLIPHWNIQMGRLSNPLLGHVRTLGMMKLLYRYGGIICPPSFLCMNNLKPLYEKGTRDNQMFLCEMVDRSRSSDHQAFSASIQFCGAPKQCDIVGKFCNYIESMTSHDATDETAFLGQYNRWCARQIEKGNMRRINGIEIGTKTLDDTPILIDDLMSNHYLELYKGAYGIYIPADELLVRHKYGWFVRSSAKQVLESDTIIGNYLLLSIDPQDKAGILEPLVMKPNWVGFWKTPNLPSLYGVKPNHLGNHLHMRKI